MTDDSKPSMILWVIPILSIIINIALAVTLMGVDWHRDNCRAFIKQGRTPNGSIQH